MVFKRRYVSRKRRYNRYSKKTFRRGIRSSRMVHYMPRKIGTPYQKVYFFKRHANDDPLLATTDSTDLVYSYNFTLDSIPNYSEWTALFDMYKINRVVVEIMPAVNVDNANVNTGSLTTYSTFNNLRIFTCVDYNSFQGTTIDSIREYSNCKVTRYTRGQKRHFRPMATIAGSSGTTAGMQFTQLGNPWIQCTNASVPHYSLAVGIDTSLLDPTIIAPNDILARVEVTYYVSFKNAK